MGTVKDNYYYYYIIFEYSGFKVELPPVRNDIGSFLFDLDVGRRPLIFSRAASLSEHSSWSGIRLFFKDFKRASSVESGCYKKINQQQKSQN